MAHRSLGLVSAVALVLAATACSRASSSGGGGADARQMVRPAVTLGVTTLTPTPTPSPSPAPPSPSPVPSPSPTPTATPTPDPSAAIRSTDWQHVVAAELQVENTPGEVRIGDVIYADLTGDGRDEAVVPVLAGGTAGIIGYYVYTAAGNSVVRLLARHDPQIMVTVENGRLVETVPVPAAGDPRCCPSLLRRTIYYWSGTAMLAQAPEIAPNPNR